MKELKENLNLLSKKYQCAVTKIGDDIYIEVYANSVLYSLCGKDIKELSYIVRGFVEGCIFREKVGENEQ